MKGSPPPTRRSWVQRLVLAMNLVLIAVALGAALVLGYGYERASGINRVALDRSLTALPNDVQPGDRVLNILLVGSDSSAGLDPNDPIQIGRKGERFGDVIIIAHLDEAAGTIALLSLPRDLWVTTAGSSSQRRINAAFESGGPSGLIDTIEQNFAVPIHHYVNVDFAGFQGLVEAVGSVDLYFETPARDWDAAGSPPRSRTGFIVETAGCHTLGPDQALAYVRSRYYQTMDDTGDWVTDPTSDLGRIRRQQGFLKRLAQRAIDRGARNPFVLKDLIDTALDNVVVDQELTGQLLVDLGGTFRSFEPDQLQTYSFPVTDAVVGTDQVLAPDLANAEPILALFRGAESDDPATVLVSIATDVDAEAGERALAVGQVLTEAGFTPASVVRKGVAAGVTVEHGPDGAAAAALVAEAFAPSGTKISAVQRPFLAGRTILVVVGEDQRTHEEASATSNSTSSSQDSAPNEENGLVKDPIVGSETVPEGRTVEGESQSGSGQAIEPGSTPAQSNPAQCV